MTPAARLSVMRRSLSSSREGSVCCMPSNILRTRRHGRRMSFYTLQGGKGAAGRGRKPASADRSRQASSALTELQAMAATAWGPLCAPGGSHAPPFGGASLVAPETCRMRADRHETVGQCGGEPCGLLRRWDPCRSSWDCLRLCKKLFRSADNRRM